MRKTRPRSQECERSAVQLIIEDLEWQLEAADGNIKYCEERADKAREWLRDAEKELVREVEKFTKATKRKEELQQALEVLRSHV